MRVKNRIDAMIVMVMLICLFPVSVYADGGPDKVTIFTQPSAIVGNNMAFAVQPVIRIEDQDGNLVTDSTLEVTASIQEGGTGDSGLIGTTSVAAVSTGFNFNGLTPAVIGVVNEGAKTISLSVPDGTDVTGLAPTITHTGVSIAPASGTAQNFTNPVTYTVTAADASTQGYVVTVTFLPSYQVTYDDNGATSGTVPSAQTKTQGVDLTLEANTGSLAKTGYTLTGWNTNSAGTGTHFALGGTYTNDEAVTLYAQWTANAYTVTFDGNNGAAPSPASKPVTFDATYGDLATTSRTGYTFVGWFTAASGGTEVTARQPRSP